MATKGARIATWRARLPVLAVVVACVGGVVAAVTGAANPVSAVQFLLPGHWVYNDALGSVFHVDGSTGNVDARAHVPGGPGDLVVQGDTSGYVVGSSRVTEFGKSTLDVVESTTPASRSMPVGIETVGGPYLVYRLEGKVVRLGDPAVAVSLGGPVGTPVATEDGTVWLPRTSAGLLCKLTAGARSPSCPIPLRKGNTGGLTVVGDQLVFVDTTADTLHAVEQDRLGPSRDLGVDVSADARLASTDVDGRVVILDGRTMHLVDPDEGRPVEVVLPDGEYDGPVSTGKVVAVVEKKSGTLTTFDSDGTRKGTKKLPAEKGDPRISRGEDDRVYVDGAEGEHVVVVDEDGDMTDVPITDETPDRTAPPRETPDEGTPREVPDERTPPAEETSPPDTRQRPQPPTSDPRPPVQAEPPRVPATPPGAPTGVTATAGNQSATVRWGPAPANRAPVTGYTITWPGGRTTAGPNARSADIGGLTNGTSYVFTVAAANAVGTGPGASSGAVTPTAPFRAASAPMNLTADNDTAGSTVSASWAAPADMGTGTFVHYAVEVVGLRQATVTGTSVSFDDIQVDREVTVRVTTVTADPGGRQGPGGTATTVTGQPGGGTATVRLSEVPAPAAECGGRTGCAWMRVELSGFPPSTDIYVDPDSTEPGYSNDGATITTDAAGNATADLFPYAVAGVTVHVNAYLDDVPVRSNDEYWDGN